MLGQTPTQSTPAGCFVGVMVLFPLAVSILGLYGLYRWWQIPEDQRLIDQRFWILVAAFVFGALGAFLLVVISKRLLGSIDFRKYDSKDPDEPSLKF